MYKPRRYLYKEFEVYLSRSSIVPTSIIEVGCGYGSSIFPLYEYLSSNTKFIATDFSSEALQILTHHPKFNSDRILTHQWDILDSPDLNITGIADTLLSVFVLSAIDPKHHIRCLTNINLALSDGGYVLFRDYAIHDMTMYRHKIRISQNLFRRHDGTLAYYFDRDYLDEISSRSGFIVMELSYSTVKVNNRSSKQVMNRIFIHAVLKKVKS